MAPGSRQRYTESRRSGFVRGKSPHNDATPDRPPRERRRGDLGLPNAQGKLCGRRVAVSEPEYLLGDDVEDRAVLPRRVDWGKGDVERHYVLR